jgi:hypothetical protein
VTDSVPPSVFRSEFLGRTDVVTVHVSALDDPCMLGRVHGRYCAHTRDGYVNAKQFDHHGDIVAAAQLKMFDER